MKNFNKITFALSLWLLVLGLQSPITAAAQEKSKWSLVKQEGIGAGKVAPAVSFIDVNGSTVRLSDYKGKIVLLDVWATWCKPCLEGMPEMDKVYNKHKDEVVMLAVCSADNRNNFNAFVKNNSDKYNFTYLFDPNGLTPKAGDFRTLYGINGFPTTMVIDQKGVIAGYGSDHDMTISDHQQVELIINKLRKSPLKTYELQDAIDDNREGNYKEGYRKSLLIPAESDSAKNDLVYTQIESLLHIDEKAAVELAKKQLIENDNDSRFLTNLGVLITQAKDLSPASYLYGVEVLQKVVASSPAYDSFLIMYDFLGRCYFKAGNVQEAISYAEKAIADGKKVNTHPDTMVYLQGVLDNYKKSQK